MLTFLKRLIWVCYFALGMVSCAYLISEVPKQLLELTPFEYVCQELAALYPGTDCAALEDPIIIYSSIIDDAAGRWAQWHGVYYWGEPYIFVNPDDDEEQQAQTIMHEMVHYVVWENDLPPKEDTCENERVARIISGGTWTDLEKGYYGC